MKTAVVTGDQFDPYDPGRQPYRRRLDSGEAAWVVYLCNPASASAVRTALRQPAARPIAELIDVHVTHGPQTATWEGNELPRWLDPLALSEAPASAVSGGIDPSRGSGKVHGGQH